MRTFTLHRRRPAQPVDLAFLQGAQQLRLQADIHLADFVEQQRAAIGRLEFADTARDGAGERTLLVAEQLELQQVLGDCRTVQRDERPADAARTAMDMARQHLLAGAGFADDQHRGLGRRDLFGAADGCLHGRVAHDQRVGFAGGRLQDGGDQVGIGRQRQELARAGADGAGGRLCVVAGAAGDNRHRDAFGSERAHHPPTSCARSHSTRSMRASARRRASAGIGVIRLVELAPRAIAMRAA